MSKPDEEINSKTYKYYQSLFDDIEEDIRDIQLDSLSKAFQDEVSQNLIKEIETDQKSYLEILAKYKGRDISPRGAAFLDETRNIIVQKVKKLTEHCTSIKMQYELIIEMGKDVIETYEAACCQQGIKPTETFLEAKWFLDKLQSNEKKNEFYFPENLGLVNLLCYTLNEVIEKTPLTIQIKNAFNKIIASFKEIIKKIPFGKRDNSVDGDFFKVRDFNLQIKNLKVHMGLIKSDTTFLKAYTPGKQLGTEPTKMDKEKQSIEENPKPEKPKSKH